MPSQHSLRTHPHTKEDNYLGNSYTTVHDRSCFNPISNPIQNSIGANSELYREIRLLECATNRVLPQRFAQIGVHDDFAGIKNSIRRPERPS